MKSSYRLPTGLSSALSGATLRPLALCLLVALAACSPAPPTPTISSAAKTAVAQVPSPTPTRTPGATPTRAPVPETPTAIASGRRATPTPGPNDFIPTREQPCREAGYHQPLREKKATVETVEQAYRCLLLHHVGRNTVDHRALLNGALAGLERAGKGKLTAEDLAPLEFANDREADWGVFAARFNAIAARPGRALDAGALARAAIDAMAASLNDNHVAYLEPKLWLSTFYAIAGFDVYPSAGFAVAIDPASGKYYLYEVFPNSPAARAGLKRGDIVERVGGGPASQGVNNQALYNLLVGLPGTGDVVEVTRPATGQTFSVIVRVADVEVPVIEARMLPGGIGYVKLRHFAFSVDEDFDEALAALRRQGLRGLIFDVRQNGGGSLAAMAGIASHFTHDGPLAILVDENGARQELPPDTGVPLLTVPWVVLADGASASASDMTSAVARDRGGHLVGQRSAGALGAALFYELEDGSAMEITVARVLGPDGEEINEVGVEPHHAITLTPLDLSSDWDPQLQHAIDELAGR